jgi:proline dehydrogenase
MINDSSKIISFDNTEYAFAHMNNAELRKARFLFSMMGKAFWLKLGLKLMPLAIKYKFPFTKTILKRTIFNQFVGGENLEKTFPVSEKLAKYGVDVILDYGVEGLSTEEGFNQAEKAFIDVVNYAASQKSIPFVSIKVTGIASFTLLERIHEAMQHSKKENVLVRYQLVIRNLLPNDKAEWDLVCTRLENICKAASKSSVAILVDAEESWIQDPVDALTTLMMEQFNKTKAVVYNTIQLYRHDRLRFLQHSIQMARIESYILGVKLVRGAYMEKERARALENNYPSPIQPDKDSTDLDYNTAVDICLQQLDQIAVIIASHNEESNFLATLLCEEYGIAENHEHLHFSQLYGMSDNITYNLAKNGFSVSKYLPFGPIKEVLPYLMRRAQENSSVAGQTGRELNLITKELERRKQK